jgi:vacuolar-type H+-ATPase subunit I/STV1
MLKKERIYVTVIGDDGKEKGRLYKVVEGVESARKDGENLKDTFDEEVNKLNKSKQIWSVGDEKMYSVSDENLDVLRDIGKLEKDKDILPSQAKRLDRLKDLKNLWMQQATGGALTEEDSERFEKLKKEEKAAKEAETAKEPKN